MKTRIFTLLLALVISVPTAIGQDAAGAQELSLRRQKFHALPPDIWRMPDLHTLDLSFNPITELPDSIATLRLTHLNLVRTYVTDFPASVAGSPLAATLQYLDMRGCRLTEEQQEAIRALFPDAVIRWDFPCDCGAD